MREVAWVGLSVEHVRQRLDYALAVRLNRPGSGG